jgi:uncharacterized repeat protein (TIGR01451 family)
MEDIFMFKKRFFILSLTLLLSLMLSSLALGSAEKTTHPSPANIHSTLSQAAPILPQERSQSKPIHSNYSAQKLVNSSVPARVPAMPALAETTHSQVAALEVQDGAYARVNTTWDSVDGSFREGVRVWYSVTGANGSPKGGGEGVARQGDWLDGIGCGCDIIPGDKVRVQSDAGFDAVLTPIPISGKIDVETDQVFGTMYDASFPAGGGIWVWSEARKQGSWQEISIATDGAYSAEFSPFDIQTGDQAEVWYFDENGNLVGVNVFTLQIQVNYAHDWVYAWTEPNAWIDFSINDGEFTLHGQADGRGEFRGWEWSGAWSPSQPDILPGDVVTASTADFTREINPIRSISIEADKDAETVSGVLEAGWFTEPLRVDCDIYGDQGFHLETTANPLDGTYLCDFGSADFDIVEGNEVTVRYYEPDTDQVINVYRIPRLDLRVNYGHDWVESFYEAGHTAWVEVKDSKGNLKASAELVTEPKVFWGGQEGFQTRSEDWTPFPPDIQPGDWVLGRLDDGKTAQVQIGEISGTINLAADTIAGTIAAPWFSSPVEVECHSWGRPAGPEIMKYDSVVPNGSADYTCAWDSETEWDILAGQDVGVGYFGPDHHWVANAIRIPAPYLHIWTWADGSPGEGSNFAYKVNYQNTGEAAAKDTVVKATLTGNVTYLSDTSGFTPTGSGAPGDPLIWQVGELPPSKWGHEFTIFARVDALAGTEIGIHVEIETSTIYYHQDSSTLHSQWSMAVQANDTRLSVSKSTWTGDPAKGYNFVYEINMCNNGATASLPVTLTDHLAGFFEPVSWWSPQPGWLEIGRNTQSQPFYISFTRPTIAGNTCSQVLLRMRFPDIWLINPWRLFSNTAQIECANDMDPENNQSEIILEAGNPHTNLALYKDWRWGRLTPGGEITYEFFYANNGNVPVANVSITGRLPDQVRFIELLEFDRFGGNPVREILPAITNRAISWSLGTVENGASGRFQLRLQLSRALVPGINLDFSLEISPQALEDNIFDNSISWSDRLNDFGPNLYVHSQNFHWDGKERIWYEIRIKNLGSERLENFEITDILPASTTLDGWWQNHGPEITGTPDPTNQQIVFSVSGLNPGETASLSFFARLDASRVGVQGLAYQNTVSAPIPGEVNPADNLDQATAYTGPDLYVEKWKVSGQPKPGAKLTFLVRLGNHNQWPWEVSVGASVELMENLPKGMKFVRAYWPDGKEFTPKTNDSRSGIVTWDLGRLGGNDLRWFYLVVELDKTVKPGTVLKNHVLVREKPAIDTDPLPANNNFLYSLKVVK